MKYQIGEQVYTDNTKNIEVIEHREVISGVGIYYTLSGKSFSESQLSRFYKTYDDAKEIMNNVVDFLASKIKFTFKNRDSFSNEAILRDLEKYKKIRLENERSN